MTNPITDETSVVLRRRADLPHRDAYGALSLPSLATTWYGGREVLLSLEAFEAAAEGYGTDPGETQIVDGVGNNAPVDWAWHSSATDDRNASLDRHLSSLLMARVQAVQGPMDALFRYLAVPDGVTRTARFVLKESADLLPRLGRACRSRSQRAEKGEFECSPTSAKRD